MVVLIGYSGKRWIGFWVSLRLQYFIFCLLLLLSYTDSNSVICVQHKDKMSLSDTVVQLATTRVLLWPLSPFIRVTCYPSPQHLRGPERDTHTLSHTHTQQTESSLSFWNMCVSALISSLYISLTLSYSPSQWYLILHSVEIGFISVLDQYPFVYHGGGLWQILAETCFPMKIFSYDFTLFQAHKLVYFTHTELWLIIVY